MLIYLLLFGLNFQILYADYAGYNAAGRNPGYYPEARYDPVSVPNTYHTPNEYENQPHSYWYENKPFPHAHAGQPETYDGKIHQHMPGAEPPTMQNFITDPPGIGLNAPENKDNYKSECDESNPYGESNCGNKFPEVVQPTTTGPVGPSSFSTKLPYKSAHSSTEELINENLNKTDKEKSDVGKIVSLHESHSVVEDLTKKLPCCACCKEETKQVTPVQPTTLRPVFTSYVKPSLGGGTYSSYVQPSSGSWGSYSVPQNSYYSTGGCSSSYSYGSSAGCCQEQVPTCCAPQLPCCPRIEFPCCPQQPICCQPIQGCGQCRSRVLKQRRTKRFGCIPCGGRRKRDVLDEFHLRRKLLACVPCLKRRKRDTNHCLNCSPFTSHLVNRLKRSAKNGCVETSRRLTSKQTFGLNRSRRETYKDVGYDSLLECDKSCCDYSKCIRSKPLTQ